MIGLPYLLAAAAIACVLAFGTGWHYGGKVVRADWAAERLHIAQQSEQERTRIAKADQKSDQRAATRNAKRQQVQQITTQTVIDHATTLPDPVECRLDPERVSNINAALGVADPGGEAPAVPDANAVEERKSPSSRGVGGALGLRLPAVQ